MRLFTALFTTLALICASSSAFADWEVELDGSGSNRIDGSEVFGRRGEA